MNFQILFAQKQETMETWRHQLYLYLNIRGVSLTVSPGSANAWKATLWVVKFVVMGTKEEGGVGFLQKKTNET